MTLAANSSEEVAAKILKSTVRVVTLKGGVIAGHGTGFVITSNGHVATNRHVVEGGTNYAIAYAEGERVRIREAVLVGVSSTADLAILKSEPIPGTTAVQVASADLVVGQTVMAVGFPGAIDTGSWATLEGVAMDGKSGDGRITNDNAKSDFQPAVFPGSVAKSATLDGIRIIFHSAKISPGNSGGPLIDSNGRVCGVNTAFIPAEKAGSDYPISIHVAELVALAHTHSIQISVSASKASATGDTSSLHVLLWIVVAAFAVVMFLLVLRKPRMVMVDAVSKLVHSRHPAAPSPARRPPHDHAPSPSLNRCTMRLRGRDLHGISYDIAFNDADFRRCGGRLVIGRNKDLSQLLLSHDSVSRQHATLTLNGATVQVEDRNSGNGTKLNGRDLTVGAAPGVLKQGDRLTLGEVDLMFEVFN